MNDVKIDCSTYIDDCFDDTACYASEISSYYNSDLEKYVFTADGHNVEMWPEKEKRTDGRTAMFMSVDGTEYEVGYNLRFKNWYYGIKGYGYKTEFCLFDILYQFKIQFWLISEAVKDLILMSPNSEELRVIFFHTSYLSDAENMWLEGFLVE